MRISRLARTAIAVAAPLALVLAPFAARADFHPACVPFNTGDARVDMTASGGSFTWSGTVFCRAAASVDVNVTLSKPSDGTFTPVTISASCADPIACLNPVVASKTQSLAAGTYQVKMLFTAKGPVGPVLTFTNVPRCSLYGVSGSTATLLGGC